ncbi:mitochondrial inner membrane translocase subunit TIM44 [Trichodelitschia bisporula]|uniref:Mitochondrial import inner membrane translocase subunit TIM44 n=1 Tax=Trichodelitschia bisporula TaxID=703511 RepID=A0A6G1HZB0_9PEZI|nr:mitochondrial inner membrane translocase subunit TIM44 [Trichodelitschia bisporula]
MRSLTHGAGLVRARTPTARQFPSQSQFGYGRTAAYRRLIADVAGLQSLRAKSHISLVDSVSPTQLLLRSLVRPQHFITTTSASNTRTFHSDPRLFQEAKEKKNKAEAVSKESLKDEATQTEDAEGSVKAKKSEGEESTESKSDEAEGEKKDGDKGGEKDKKDDATPPPPHGDKTPWQVFTETLKTEFKASKEWNESTKALASGYSELAQSEAIRKAREAYVQASGAAASTTGAALKKTGHVVGKSATYVWETPVAKVVRKGATVAGHGIEKATRPIRETEAFKSVTEVIDDGSSSRYGGWVEKEERRRRRELREAQMAKNGGIPTGPMEEDPNAGTNVTVHKDAAWKEQWRDFRDTSKLMQSLFSLKSTYKESENPLVSTMRSISDGVAGFFAENETAMVIKKFREMDPNFQLEPFLTEMREYILPEVLDAYVKGDVETLKLWLSAPQYQVYAALMAQYTTAGLKSDGTILDIRNVDILSAKILDPGDIPVFIVTCRTNEVHVYRSIKTGDLAAGVDDKVQQVTYAIGITRIPEEVSNPETRGWRLIELQKSARDYI